MRNFLSIVSLVFAACVTVFGLSYGSYAMYQYFAPKYRQVDNQVFKQSEQYNDGMIRDLQELEMQYMTASDTQKATLKSIILHRFEVYDQSKLPPDLWSFYNDVKQGKL
jgi:hypothetical protein